MASVTVSGEHAGMASIASRLAELITVSSKRTIYLDHNNMSRSMGQLGKTRRPDSSMERCLFAQTRRPQVSLSLSPDMLRVGCQSSGRTQSQRTDAR
jgi:hypothetical protein